MTNRDIFESQYRRLADTLPNGNLEPVLDLFAKPVAVYHDDQLIMPMEASYLCQRTNDMAKALKAMGATDFSGEIVSFAEKGTSLRVKVDRHAQFSGKWRRIITIEYFGRIGTSGLKIEMLVVTNLDAELSKKMKSGKGRQGVKND